MGGIDRIISAAEARGIDALAGFLEAAEHVLAYALGAVVTARLAHPTRSQSAI